MERFKSFYGSKPIVCAQIWEDLQTTDIVEARIEAKSQKDVDYFLMAHHFLTCYPLNYLRKQMRQKKNHAARDSAALVHDRAIYPKPHLNHRGEPRWEGSEAERLLREDMQQRMHEYSGKSLPSLMQMSLAALPPEQLWLSRDEYQDYQKDTFRQHIHQEK